MSSFTEPLLLEALDSTRGGRGEFRVAKEFVYEVGSLGSGDKIVVPVGFVTDLASIPFFARAFIPLSGRLAKPALIHDWLFENSDPRASSVFEEALRVNCVNGNLLTIVATAVKVWWFIKKVLYVEILAVCSRIAAFFTGPRR